MDDSRFKRFATDPKFRLVPKKERKVKIDPRFKSMFSDKRFVTKVQVDKRGRPKNFAAKENFEKFYDLQSSSSDDDEAQEVDSPSENLEKESRKKDKKVLRSEQSDTVQKVSRNKSKSVAKKEEKIVHKKVGTSKVDDLTIKRKIHSDEVDYARGESRILTDSSSSDDSSDDESDDEAETAEPTAFDKWGELDCDAGNTEESTKRVAVCNMDWDRVGAKDIFVALNSFCPPGGNVNSVSVYLSEFGKERLAEEDVLGPHELRENKNEGTSDFDDDGEVDSEAMERIRIYQVNRLKYYYAVAIFNSKEAADKVYQDCDGMEYELSATKFDLRFIPDEMAFDEEPKEICDQMPRPEDYKPKIFENTALKQGKVNLTWDETDPNRLAVMRRAFEVDDDDEDNVDVKAYLANSSDEDETDDMLPIGNDEQDELGSSEDDEAVVSKYKALLSDIKEKQKKTDLETDMEVSFIPNDVVTEKMKLKEIESMTPWEQYLAKKKEKRKAKKQKSKNEKDEEDDKPFSDDDLPDGIDPDDPFFKNTEDKDDSQKNKKKKKGKKNVGNKEEGDDKTGLSLLLMESDDDKDHFDYKEIVKKESKKSKKRKSKKADNEKEDDFKIDFNDQRFSAIFKKAEFNVDPSNPNFKKTKSMQAIIEEKQRRLLRADENPEIVKPPPEKKAKSSSLDNLVHAVKSKSNRMNKMSKKK